MDKKKSKTKCYRKGGKTSLEMKQVGRGMAKVQNQLSPVRSVRKTGV